MAKLKRNILWDDFKSLKPSEEEHKPKKIGNTKS